MINKNGFYRPWDSQEQGPKGEWIRFDQRGKIAAVRKEKWFGMPLSDDKNADNWRGLSFEEIEIERRIGFEVGTSEERMRVRVYTAFENLSTMDFISEVKSSRDGNVALQTTCHLKYPDFIEGEFVTLQSDGRGGATIIMLVSFFNIVKKVLDKPEYDACFFSHIKDANWIYDKTKHENFSTLWTGQ